MLAYSIDLVGLRELQASFRKSPQIVVEELDSVMTEVDLLLEREVSERMPTGAQGFLKRSVFGEEEINESGVIGLVASPMSYAVPVELGTKPHFPPLQPLLDWVMHSPTAQAKFGTLSEKTARGVAFAIARKISISGTEAKYPFKSTLQDQEGWIQGKFEGALKRIADRLVGGTA